MTSNAPASTHDALKAYFHSNSGALKQAVIAELAKWIQFDSLAGNEDPIQRHIQSQLQELGLETDMFYLNDIPNFTSHPHFVSPRTDFSKSPNLVGILKSKNPLPNGKSLILNGHIDVVPVGALNTWTKEPFGGEYDPKDDKLYGRGVTDMKAGLYACILALKAVIKSGIDLGGDIIVESVVEEESGGAGTLAAILKGYKADGAIISEPTSTKIFPIQQGSMWFRVKVQGRGAHGGTRYEGVSAIEKSMKVVSAILELEKKRNDGLAEREVLFKGIPIPVPINIGRIEGGKWPSSVPDEVILEGRMGIIPGEEMKDAQAQLAATLSSLAESDDWFRTHPCKVEYFGAWWQPGLVNPTHPLVESLKSHYKTVYVGKEAKVEASPWATDGGRLTHLADTPSIVFGPGVTSMAHFPDEYVVVDDVLKCAEIIAHTIIDWCGAVKK